MSRDHLSTYARTVVPDARERDPHDFYPTPPSATRALLAVEPFEGTVWEPACGTGEMAEALRAAGYAVIATDLVDRDYGIGDVDFLGAKQRVDNVVTNPPFRLAQAFAEQGLRVARRKVALLCRLMWLEGKARRSFFEAAPLARVWVFSDRVPFQRARLVAADEQGGRMVPYAWFVFEHGHAGAPSIGWIEHGAFA